MSEHIDTLDYALDALDEVGRRRAQSHLRSCPLCRVEVDAWRADLSVLADSVPAVEPPPELRERVLRVVSEGSTAAQPADAAHAPRRAAALLAAVAAAVLIAAGVAVGTHPWSGGTRQAAGLAVVTDAADARRTTAGMKRGSLVVVSSAHEGKAVATLRGIAPAGAGKVYQAWYLTPAGPVSAGVVQPGKPTVLTGSMKGAKAAAITIEPEGGSERPTSSPIVSVSMA